MYPTDYVQPSNMLGQTAVYRFYSRSGELLYVGLTDSPERRFAQHRLTQEWWGDVQTVELEWHPARSDAFKAETAAIKTESPLHNVKLTPRSARERPYRGLWPTKKRTIEK